MIHLLLFCLLLAILGSQISCTKIEAGPPPDESNLTALKLIADETYFKGHANEFDFYIITYSQEIAEALKGINCTIIESEDTATQLFFTGEYYLQVETLIDSIEQKNRSNNYITAYTNLLD